MTAAASTEQRSRFKGALFGLAVGDALAFPWKGRSRSFLRSVESVFQVGFVRHETKFFPSGQGTDDSQTALALCRTLRESRSRSVDGKILAEFLVPLWRDGEVVDPAPESTDAVRRLISGKTLFDSSGHAAGRIGADALARAVPIGLWYHNSPVHLIRDVDVSTSVTHKDPRVLACAAVVAAVVAYNVRASDVLLGEFLDQLAEAAGRFHGRTAEMILDFPRILSMIEFRALERIDGFLRAEEGADHGDWWEKLPGASQFQLLAALYYFLRAPFDFERSVDAAFHAGGEVLSVCALVGAFSGSFLGDQAIPVQLRRGLVLGEQVEEEASLLYEAWLDASSASASTQPHTATAIEHEQQEAAE